MAEYTLSVLIPARNEEYLSKTVEDLLANSNPETEIIIGLDGRWAEPPIIDNPRVSILHYSESIGQRAITNQLCRLSKAKFVMKLDAHCAMDKDFDTKLLADMHDDWTMAPTMRNLHIFNWICPDGHVRYQGPSGPCKDCGKPTTKQMVWNPKTNPQSVAYCFDAEPHFQYDNRWKNTEEYKKGVDGDTQLNESMSLQGSCFVMTRDKYWELNICDESFGSWGSQGIEVACKTWLSGGRVVISHKTWYGHCFRTQGLDFGFPYPISGKQVEAAKKLAGNKLFENNWPRQIRPSSWLIDKFWPVPGWSDSDRTKVTEAGTSFIDKRFEELGFLGIIPSIPSTMTNHATPVSVDGRGEKMTIVAMGLSKLFGSSTVALQDIISIRDELKMGRITTQSIVTNMVKNGDILTFSTGNITDHPSIHQTVNPIPNLIDTDISVPISSNSTSPDPALIDGVNFNLSKDSTGGLSGDVHNTIIPQINNSKTNMEPTKGCIYYTDNLPPEKLLKACQKQLWKAAVRDHKMPIVSCSLKPMDFGKNIVLPLERGYITMTKQILKALETLTTDIVFFCEHDDLYDKSHFDFTPKDKETWYYNSNYWMLRLPDGFAIQYNVSPLSGLCVYRETAIKHYKERLELMEGLGDKLEMLKIGFEPFTHNRIDWKYKCKFETFQSTISVIDISHGSNVTKKRWSQDQFRRKPTFWQESTDFQVPDWDNLKRLLG